MDKFLDRFKPKKANSSNLFGGIFGNNNSARSFQGHGQSLGGSQPGQVIPILLSEAGPLGIKVEKRPNNAAIVNMVVEGSQAQRAGILRGDILCFAGTNGSEEIMYDEFLQLAKSSQRPLALEVRRVRTKAGNDKGKESADSLARKNASIAAAEARQKAFKKTQKPIRKTDIYKSNAGASGATEDYASQSESQSEESKQAIAAAKKQEEQYAETLGYNPYETNKVTAGQARNTTVAMAHGSIQADKEQQSSRTTDSVKAKTYDSSESKTVTEPVSDEFQHAFETTVTSNDHTNVVKSFNILQKLITNATTKGQSGKDDSDKFRRVRLDNPKINAAVVQVEGAIDLLMSVNFQLFEDGGESVLVFPPGDPGPPWLPNALAEMENYAKS